jgi:hypothetical protein
VDLVLDPERRDAEEFLRREAGRTLSEEEEQRGLKLLELERHAQLMYTSCGWFFSELSGIETVQILRYAARGIQLARDLVGLDLEPAFEAALARAPSNDPALGDGRKVYRTLVKPSVVTLEGVGAHLAIAASVRPLADAGTTFCYTYRLEGRRAAQSGPVSIALGRVQLENELTREALDAVYCVLHFGAADFRCGLAPYRGAAHLEEIEQAILARSHALSLAHLLRAVDRHFPGRDYGLGDLFLDERRAVAEVLLEGTMRRYEDDYLDIFEDNRRLMEFLHDIDSPVPGPLRVAADVTLTRRLLRVTGAARAGDVDLASAEIELSATVELARRLGAHLHLAAVRRDVEALVASRLAALLAGKSPAMRATELAGILALAHRLGLELDLWDAQNKLWAWAGSTLVTLDRAAAAELARHLWFDEATLLARAGFGA